MILLLLFNCLNLHIVNEISGCHRAIVLNKPKKKIGYAVEVLSDAMQYAAHTDSKASIDIGDLKMAIQARVNTSFTPAPSREVKRVITIVPLWSSY